MTISSFSQGSSLAELIDLAITNDQRLQQAKSLLQASQASIDIETSLGYPQINLSGSVNQTEQTESVELDYTNASGELAIEQELWQRSINQKQHIRTLDVTQKQLALQNATQQLLTELSKAFFALFEARSAITLAQVQINTYSNSLKLEQQRQQLGVSTITQVATIEAELANARAQLLLASVSEQVALDTLEQLVGKKVVIPELVTDPQLAVLTPDLATLQQQMLQNNFTLQLARLELQQADAQLSLAKTETDPTIKLFGKLVHATNPQGIDTENTFYQYGLSFRIPLYTGGSTSANVTQNEYQSVAAGQGIDYLYATLPVQLRAQWQSMQVQLQVIDANTKSILAAQKALELADASYVSGVGNQQQLLDSQSRFFLTQTQLDNAKYTFARQQIDMYALIGRLDKSNVLAIADIWLVQ